MKEQYIALMEKALAAYSDEHIRRYTAQAERDGIAEHGFPRLTADIGILLCHGRLPQYRELFIRMMGLCCEQIPNHEGRGNDFSVKELTLCLLEAERSGQFAPALTERWRQALSGLDPYRTYTVIAPDADTPVNNWAAFAAASEQLRRFAGMPTDAAFIETQIGSQTLSFDEIGMYRDPHEPMVYDYTARAQLAVALHFGFDGKCAAELRETLMRAAELTLAMQSVTGEAPFGGRSNQFLHNETSFAALCEFYAAAFAASGDAVRAGQFRRAARNATESVLALLDRTPITHIKNRYPTDSGYGCESYAYFDKYMVTAASCAYLAYCMADDTIPEAPLPTGYVRKTSPHFHKVFLQNGTYFAEVEQDADFCYDANGLGRIHRHGAPSALCLSVPFPPAGANYKTDFPNREAASLCGGIRRGDGFLFSSVAGTKRTLTAQSDDPVFAAFAVLLKDGTPLTETVALDGDGVTLTVAADGEVCCQIPLFAFDGEAETDIRLTEHTACVTYGGYVCRFDTDGTLFDPQNMLANRNGHYREMIALGNKSLRLTVRIEPV